MKRMPKPKSTRPLTRWQQLVRETARKNPGKKIAEIARLAKAAYKK
jgi:hypothetical protein